MVVLPSIVAALILVLHAIFEYRRSTPFIVFPVAVFMIAGVPLTFSVDLIDRYGASAVQASGFFFLIFSIVIYLVRSISAAYLVQNSPFRLIYLKPSKAYTGGPALMASIILCLSAIAMFVFGLKIFSLTAAISLGWWEFVNSNSPIVLMGTYFSYSSAGILVFSILCFRRNFFMGVSGVFVAVTFLAFSLVVLKTRSYVLLMIFPISIYLMYRRGLQYKLYMVFIVALSGLMFIVARSIRHAGSFSEFMASDMSELFSGAMDGSEAVLVDAFVYFVQVDNNIQGFGEGATLLRLLFFWIPSFVADVKPIEFSYVMHAAYFRTGSITGLSMHPTILGDAFANHGYIGAVIYGALIGFGFSLVEKWGGSRFSINGLIFISSILSVSLLALARGAVYNSFMFTVIPIFLYFLLYKILFFLRRFYRGV